MLKQRPNRHREMDMDIWIYGYMVMFMQLSLNAVVRFQVRFQVPGSGSVTSRLAATKSSVTLDACRNRRLTFDSFV